jgi:hypothetical protein
MNLFDTPDLLAIDGGLALKAIDDDGGIEGPCAPFGDADRSRLKDRFTAETDFGRAMKTGAELRSHHGLPMIGDRPNALADVVLGEATFEKRGDALYMKSRLDLSTEENRRLFAEIKAGKQYLSTGSASHLVRRKALADGTHEIKAWPIVEVSITPTPAHPRTAVYPIKSLIEEPLEAPPEPPESAGFVESLKRAESALDWASQQPDLNAKKAEAIKSLAASARQFDPPQAPPAASPPAPDDSDLYAQFLAIESRLNGAPVAR